MRARHSGITVCFTEFSPGRLNRLINNRPRINAPNKPGKVDSIRVFFNWRTPNEIIRQQMVVTEVRAKEFIISACIQFPEKMSLNPSRLLLEIVIRGIRRRNKSENATIIGDA